MNSTYETLRKEIEKIALIDTHEHLRSEDECIERPCDPIALFLTHYLSTDFLTAGMDSEILSKLRDPSVPLEEKWEYFSEYWELASNTGYARVIKIALKDLYGEDEVSLRALQRVAKKMRDLYKPGFYRRILKERANIEVCILDVGKTNVDRELFVPVIRFDEFIYTRSAKDIQALERRAGMRIHDLKDLVTALRTSLEKVKSSIVGVKTGLAYRRPLSYDKASSHEAEGVLIKVLHSEDGLSFEEAKPLQDFMMHQLLSLCERYSIPVQIHTGLQEGIWGRLTDSNPSLLIDIFREYRHVKFDVFHAGYPYSRELGAIAKQFPNVYLDLCWTHAISPEGARRILSEWLDLLPSSKILAFGGDYVFVEGAYGHSRIARYNVAKVLAEKVEDRDFKLEEAIKIARRILRENAKRLFFS